MIAYKKILEIQVIIKLLVSSKRIRYKINIQKKPVIFLYTGNQLKTNLFLRSHS